jgi:hypothetical protein
MARAGAFDGPLVMASDLLLSVICCSVLSLVVFVNNGALKNPLSIWWEAGGG